jgi:tripartite-type tricarboxylate transporter receptor subunit TctC
MPPAPGNGGSTTATPTETISQGYEASGWCGIVAPKDTPIGIIDKLNNDINAALADPKFKARPADLGVTAFASSPAEFKNHIAAETEKWGKLIRAASIKPE